MSKQRRHGGSHHARGEAQNLTTGMLNGVPIDGHTHIAPDRPRYWTTHHRTAQTESVPYRSRNHPVAATLGLRPRSAPVVRTLRDRFVAWRGARAKARLERQYGEDC